MEGWLGGERGDERWSGMRERCSEGDEACNFLL